MSSFDKKVGGGEGHPFKNEGKPLKDLAFKILHLIL